MSDVVFPASLHDAPRVQRCRLLAVHWLVGVLQGVVGLPIASIVMVCCCQSGSVTAGPCETRS